MNQSLALAASSHSGEDYHRAAALEILAAADRNESDLDNTPDLPYDPTVAAAYLRSGGTATSLAQNCSGKHAAMIATCVIRGWPVSGYLDPTHPLQQAISASMARAAGERIDHIGVDGCGAPAHAFSLLGLAKAFGDARREHPAATVVEAMLRHPEMVGGSGRDVTLLMRALPGVLVKDGADGVMAASLIDGTGIALKIADGAPAPRIAVLVSVLEHFGLNVDAARTAVPLLVFGHGEPVGEIRSTLF